MKIIQYYKLLGVVLTVFGLIQFVMMLYFLFLGGSTHNYQFYYLMILDLILILCGIIINTNEIQISILITSIVVICLRYLPMMIISIHFILYNVLYPPNGLDFSGASALIGITIMITSLVPFIIMIYLNLKCIKLYFKNV